MRWAFPCRAMTDVAAKLLSALDARPEPVCIGNDVLYLPDFYPMLNALFVSKAFTERERAYAEQFTTPALRYASTFSAKESVYKAIKQWFPTTPLGWKKIEVLRDRPAGPPYCHLHHPVGQSLRLSLSISHDGEYVWTVALAWLVTG